MPSNKKKTVYQKLTSTEHMILRPDMYIGDIKNKKTNEYVLDDGKIFLKDIMTNEGLVRIFIEIVANAIDNYLRSLEGTTPVKKIKVDLNMETGETKVWNDGNIIPIEVDEKEGVYNHSLIFGNLMSGSNFNDKEDRYTSGKNGIGSSATNIFSAKFKVTGTDPEKSLKLVQVWTNNMKDTKGPKITNKVSKFGHTEVCWQPDFEKFGLKGYTDDILSVIRRIVYDTSMLCDKANVYFNGELIKIKKFQDYAKFFYGYDAKESIFLTSKDCEVIISPSSNKEYEKISFVNGIYTKNGGCHVDKWMNAILKDLLDKLNKKDKSLISRRELKQYFRIFVKSKVNKPVFDSQSKHRLESPDIDVEYSKASINKIMKWSMMKDINDLMKSKDMLNLKKTERKKRGFVRIEGMDPANLAGTKHSKDCTLVLCEGLSAKTYVVCGLSIGINGKKGRDYTGIMSLTGKILNTRNASNNVISKNKEVTNIIKALGLEYGVDYTKDSNFDKLRYGKVALLADADFDGLHIESLVLNFFHSLFPSLLKREQPFIISMKTPIVRISSKKGDTLFYDSIRADDFIKNNPKQNIKYYKGLGTTKAEDVPDTFGKKIVKYIFDDKTDSDMEKVFNKKLSDERKEWLTNYDPTKRIYCLDDMGVSSRVKISNFLNEELIKFSLSDCERSIPSVVDGFKTSQRKIFYCVKKRNLYYSGKSLKVAQLAGYVAEHSNYHHGEQNLYDTIIKMAQDFVGSNNIPLLYRDGQMGSRIQLGKDAASARYIYTKMDKCTEILFPKEDDVLLERVIDDGEIVEPTYYVPIIPLVLVNGVNAGIGTGFSSSIPSYNPKEIVEYIKYWLENKSFVNISTETSLKPLIPWYKNFKGTIEHVDTNKFKTSGVLESGKKKGEYKITEIPVTVSIDKFKDRLEDLYENKQIKKVVNHSTQNKVDFTVYENPTMPITIENLKLHSSISTSNMVLFDENNKIIKYKTVYDIIDNFCRVRLGYYHKRKNHQISHLKRDIKFLRNKERFITEVMGKKLKVMNVDEKTVLNSMTSTGYDKQEGSFEYLLKIPVRNFTKNKIDSLKEEIENKSNQLSRIQKTTIEKMWNTELDYLLTQL